MQTRLLAALLGACTIAGTAIADPPASGGETLEMNIDVSQTPAEMPQRGSTMDEVEKRFGAPLTRHAAVGQPPITRWDYNGYCVVFEHQYVIDSVVLAQAGSAAPAVSPPPSAAGSAAPEPTPTAPASAPESAPESAAPSSPTSAPSSAPPREPDNGPSEAPPPPAPTSPPGGATDQPPPPAQG